MSISGGVKFLDDSLCLSDNGAACVASTGTAVQSNILDKFAWTYWTSVGSTDSIQETLTLTFSSATFSRLLLLDHNWKNFTVQYWNGAAWTDFTSTVGLDGSLPLTGTVSSSSNTRLAVANSSAGSAGIGAYRTDTVTVANPSVGDTVTVGTTVFTGAQRSENTTFTAIANTASALNGKYIDVYEGAAPGTAVRIWFTTAGVGSAPATPTGGRLLNVNLVNGDSASTVSSKIVTALSSDTGLIATQNTSQFTVYNRTAGNVTNSTAGTSGFTLGTIFAGSSLASNEFNVFLVSSASFNALAATSLASQVNGNSSVNSYYSGSASSAVVTITSGLCSDTASYFEFDAVTTTQIQIKIKTTQVANQEKYLATVMVTNELGTLQGYPTIDPIAFGRNTRQMQMLSGRMKLVKQNPVFSCSLKFDTYPTSKGSDIDLVMTLFDREIPFYVWLCGGRRGSKYFGYQQRGFRLKDVYRVQVVSDIAPTYEGNLYTGGISNLQIDLVEHV